MSISDTLAPLIGRLAFGWFFLAQVASYGGDWSGTVQALADHGVAAAPFFLGLTLLILVMGSFSLIFGYHARYGALFLFVVTAIGTVLLHAYWRIFDNPVLRADEFQLFACHAAIAGGLLMLIGMGPGPLAVDNAGKGGGGKR